MRPARPTDTPFFAAVYLIAAVVAGLGLVVLVGGWQLDVKALRSVLPGAVGMKSATAIGFMLGGVGLWLVADPDAGRGRRMAGIAAALGVGALGAVVVAEYLFDFSLIDELLYIDHDGHALGIPSPGRPSPVTGISFMLLSAGLLSAAAERKALWRASEWAVIPMIVVCSISLVGYAYSIPAFYGMSSATKMAVHTAAAFVALGVGLLLARPRGRFVELLRTDDPGGVMLRRVGPLAVGLPLVLGWLGLRIADHGLLSTPVVTWWLSAATACVLGAVIWRCGHTLSRADAVRRELEDELKHMAVVEPLTGLANRRAFQDALDVQLARTDRAGETGVLLIIDLDKLKGVNDTLGHLTGDKLLQAIGGAIAARVRRADVAARIGGDEFAVIAPHADVAGGVALAASLLDAVRALDVDGATTTVSIGLAPLEGPQAHAEADAAMYDAKRAGGDRLIVAGDPVPV